MQLKDFDYHLPEQLVARYPLPQRSAARLLCLNRRSGAIEHRQFRDLCNLLCPGDLLVCNNTKVIPARLFATKATGGKAEILIERMLDANHVTALVRASKSPKVNSKLYLSDGTKIIVADRREELFILKITTERPLLELFELVGQTPLPPYLHREAETLDKARYQTVYAQREGAVAAPTAGLHFDDDLLKTLSERGIELGFITLHVGLGTFMPVRVGDVSQHKMHKEYIDVSTTTCAKVNATRRQGNRVIAVGTTTVRSLETAAQSGRLQPYQGDTDLFIYPGFQFRCTDAMITNFHLPQSTLLMLVSAFAGQEHIRNAYQQAVAQRYRFYSYGDAMFIDNSSHK